MKRAAHAPRADLPPPPQGTVRLDFEIDADVPGMREEWAARRAWLAHVRTHGEALAKLAVEGASPEAKARITLTADRFRALLRQAQAGRCAGILAEDRLDLATPLPNVKPWPPIFAGEPLSPTAARRMSRPLDWTYLPHIADWARAFAYYTTGLRGSATVTHLAHRHLRALLHAALDGLDPDEAPAEPTRRRKAR